MKTAVSIPDQLFASADRFARRRGMSRSELFAAALRHYLQEHQGEGITQRLDEIYGAEESSTLEPDLVRMQARSLASNDW